MPPSLLQQRRTHNTLLLQKLLNLRDGASPFTLILDTLEQSGRPVVREFVRRAKLSKTKIIFISYTTLKRKLAFEVDVFISTRSKSLSNLRSEIVSHLPQPGPASTSSNAQKYLLLIDTLTPLSTTHSTLLSPFLSSLLISPSVSLLSTYHTDIPLPSSSHTPYTPTPLQTLLYLSTAILSVSSLSHTLTTKRALDRSLHPSCYGLAERREGVIFALRNGSLAGEKDSRLVEEGVVLEMNLRRKSGRGVLETFVLSPSSSTTPPKIILLQDHPLYSPTVVEGGNGRVGEGEEGGAGGTFSLELTEKQRRDREGVVLPYFDAQSEGGVGEGGRILYEMGEEDREDFDDEEDEI